MQPINSVENERRKAVLLFLCDALAQFQIEVLFVRKGDFVPVDGLVTRIPKPSEIEFRVQYLRRLFAVVFGWVLVWTANWGVPYDGTQSGETILNKMSENWNTQKPHQRTIWLNMASMAEFFVKSPALKAIFSVMSLDFSENTSILVWSGFATRTLSLLDSNTTCNWIILLIAFVTEVVLYTWRDFTFKLPLGVCLKGKVPPSPALLAESLLWAPFLKWIIIIYIFTYKALWYWLFYWVVIKIRQLTPSNVCVVCSSGYLD